MTGFVVLPAGMWELNVIVTQLQLYCDCTLDSTGTVGIWNMMGFVVIPAGMWELNAIVT